MTFTADRHEHYVVCSLELRDSAVTAGPANLVQSSASSLVFDCSNSPLTKTFEALITLPFKFMKQINAPLSRP